MDQYAPIGVFDSGLGGISVLKTLSAMMPHENFIYFGDSARAPYGTKSLETVSAYSEEIVDFFMDKGAKAVVIACNTATSAAASNLRQKYPIPIIGMEPALKPAALENPRGTVLVMATEMTLREEKFAKLIRNYQADLQIITQAVPEFVTLVEAGVYSGQPIQAVLSHYFGNLREAKLDGIVLGCTHYVFLKAAIGEFFGHQVKIYDGNEGTARHLKDVLAQSNLLNPSDSLGKVDLFNSAGALLIERSKTLLELRY